MASMMKRFACLAFAVMLLTALVVAGAVTASAAESDEHCYLYGDVVEDGTLNPRDAIYALYHATLGSVAPGQFPVNQDCDFDGDGIVTSKDAIYLLYVVNNLLPNKGVIHAYYQPVWNWTDPENVTVTFLCGCGAGSHTYTQAEGQVSLEEIENIPGSCTAAGSLKQEASVTVDGQEYTDVHTQVTPASGHSVNADGMTCGSQDRTCTNPGCSYVVKAPAHIWEVESTTPATCQAQAVEHQRCTACNDTRDVTLEGLGNCVYAYVVGGDKDLGSCTFVKTYACIACGDTIEGTGEGDTYTTHSYKAALIQEANCTTAGIKEYTCEYCGDHYQKQDQDVDPSKHAWDDGVSEGGIITYTCTVPGCGATKTAVDATANDGKVDTGALNGEVALPGGANLSMDTSAQSGLKQDSEVAISVDQTNKDALNLDEELKAQIGENPVYDFSMSYVDTNEQISGFNGMVTISLPYELQTGDDVDCIDVWYIADDGEIKTMQGTYSNGFVTFQTDHFSYYTVTRLTPAQRCEQYGHAWVEYYRAATCTLDGVDSKICQRCGKVDHNDVLARLGHNYAQTASTATCTEAGYIEKTCQNPGCSHVVRANVQELGHTLEACEEESVAATCTAPGVIVSYCSRENCGIKHEEVIPQLEHQFGTYTTVPATCTTGGYDEGTCSVCGEKSVINVTGATGHDYRLEGGWAWSEDYESATALLVCANDPSHTHTLKGTAKADNKQAPCEGTYYIAYTVTASFNNTAYTDAVYVQREGAGHIAAEDWSANANKHYHECIVCGEAVGAEDHTWETVSVQQEATCAKPGSKTMQCTVCGEEKTVVIPATGSHSYVGGVCSVCGKEEGACEHLIPHAEKLDLTGKDICGDPEITLYKCDCGKILDMEVTGLICEFEYEEWEEEQADGSVTYYYEETCSICGLNILYSSGQIVDKENCQVKYVETRTVSLDGEILVYMEMEQGSEAHPFTEKLDEIALEGFCGSQTIVVMGCPCGVCTNVYFTAAPECNFEYDESLSSEHENWFYCAQCGGYQAISFGEAEVVGCQETYISSVRFILDGETLLDQERVSVYEAHEYELVSCELLGDTCEDGVIIRHACKNCGQADAEYSRYHNAVLEEYIDLSGEGLCCDRILLQTCACGLGGYYELLGENYCQWSYVSGSDDGSYELQGCEICGLMRSIETTRTEKDENCIVEETRVTTFFRQDAATGTKTVYAVITNTSTGYEHDYVERVELYGDSCEDGGMVYTSCRACGQYLGSHEVSHHYYPRGNEEVLDLSQYGCCSGNVIKVSCACGQYSDIYWQQGGCEWYWNEALEMDQCAVCGISYAYTEEVLEQIDSCHQRFRITYTVYHNGVKVGNLTNEGVWEDHDSYTEIDLLGQTCEDGYYYKNICADCGAVLYDSAQNGEIVYHHRRWHLGRELVYSGDDCCGPVYIVENGCGCGAVSEVWFETECQMEWMDYDPETGITILSCPNCGLERHNGEVELVPTEVPCQYVETRTYMLVKDGVELACTEERRTVESHNEITEYTRLGETCDDGYYVRRYCLDCGEEIYNSAENGEIWYGHEGNRIVSEMLHDGEGLCGPVYKYIDACACGEYYEEFISRSCNSYTEYYDEELDTWAYTCQRCGLLWIELSYQDSPTEVPCEYAREAAYIYSKDGVELFTVSTKHTYTSHRNVLYTLTLLGSTCEEGYEAVGICQDCGKESNRGTYYSHYNRWSVELTELCNVPDTCGKLYLKKFVGCPCDTEPEYEITDVCDFEYVGDSKDEGATYRCVNCGLEKTVKQEGTAVEGACLTDWTLQYTIRYNGEEITSGQVNYQTEQHRTVAQTNLLGETCEDGYTITYQCQNCDYFRTEDMVHTDHNTYYRGKMKTEDLGICEGGWIEVFSCACGQHGAVNEGFSGCDLVSDYQELSDGYRRIYTCADCGLYYEYSVSDTPTGAICEYIETDTTILSVNGNTLYAFIQTYTTLHHDYETVYTLEEGAVTCEDGVICTHTCRNCGEVRIYGSQYHETFMKEVIDLTPYGAVCGGQLEHWGCACGNRSSWQVGDDCDFGYQSTDPWIDGVAEDWWGYTSEGWNSVHSYFDDVRCAVTDPQCGLQLRYARYWLADGCVAAEYINWLGYDAATGTWVELVNEPTGAIRPYHDYVEEDFYEATPDGGQKNTGLETCSRCGSYVRRENTYDADGRYVSERQICVELTNNGFNQRYETYYEYILYGHNNLISVSKYWYTNAEGVIESGQRTEYTYGFPNACMEYAKVYNLNGELINTWESEIHVTTWNNTTIKEASCSQMGYYLEEGTCIYCNEVTESNIYNRGPNDHSFDWDSSLQIYVCRNCGLESSNGVSGDIILEDLTAGFGNNVNYVIGYGYQWYEIQFVPNVTVILEDAQGDDNQILLEGITFTFLTEEADNLTAVSCDMAKVDNAAIAALQKAGYTGSYAIRISFVPVGSGSDLDYAITFDSKTIA